MDETFRTQLLELNELHWKRFEAFLDASFAAFDLKMDQRFGPAAGQIRSLDAHFDRFEAMMNWHFDNQIRLMIVLWLATILPLGGLLIALFSTLP